MITLSIVSHGQRDIAARYLASIAALRPPLLTEIVYTRNIAEAPLPAVDLGHIRLSCVDNDRPKGFGANHNAAFERSGTPFYCVSNPDILLESDPFPALLECLGDRSLGLVAPAIEGPDGVPQNTARRLYTPVELIRQKLAPRNRGESAAWLAGMFMLFRRETFERVGGFDDRYFLYIEDVDICTRVALDGWRLRQCPEATVIHDARKQSHRSLRFAWWHLSGMIRYWRSPGFWRYRSRLAQARENGGR